MSADWREVASPSFDLEPGPSQRVEDLPVEEVVTQPGTGTLDVAILSERTRFDESRAGLDTADPLRTNVESKFGPWSRPDAGRDAAL